MTASSAAAAVQADVQAAGPHEADLFDDIDLQTFRLVMASFASGVSVITTRGGEGEPRGLTCSAVCSVSLDPPLLLSSLANRSGTLPAVLEHGRFGVNMLGAQAQSVSQLFASGSGDKFDRVQWAPGAYTGVPLLKANVAHAECVLDEAVEAGDHTLLIGRVVGGGTAEDRFPLAYWRGDYAKVLRHADTARRAAPA